VAHVQDGERCANGSPRENERGGELRDPAGLRLDDERLKLSLDFGLTRSVVRAKSRLNKLFGFDELPYVRTLTSEPRRGSAE